MSFVPPNFASSWSNSMAPLTQRQMPIFSQVGKGLRGDNSTIEITGLGSDASMVCMYNDQVTGESTPLWELPLTEVLPVLHFEIWQDVKNVDDVLQWGYWIHYYYSLIRNGVETVLWNFDTPFATTNLFIGSEEDIPSDLPKMIDHDNYPNTEV